MIWGMPGGSQFAVLVCAFLPSFWSARYLSSFAWASGVSLGIPAAPRPAPARQSNSQTPLQSGSCAIDCQVVPANFAFPAAPSAAITEVAAIAPSSAIAIVLRIQDPLIERPGGAAGAAARGAGGGAARGRRV